MNPELDKAERLAEEGQLTDAEVIFARAISSARDPAAFLRYGDFLNRVGRLVQAEEMYRKVLGLSGSDKDEWSARAYGNLGDIARIRGDFEQAEELHRKALQIHEQLGHREGVAANYRSLGDIAETRGDFEQAEELYRKALQINEELGDREEMAVAYGRLGVIVQIRGDFEQAEQLYRRARALYFDIGMTGEVDEVDRALSELENKESTK